MEGRREIETYLKELKRLMSLGERGQVEALYDEYTLHLERHDGVTILWSDGNDDLLDMHVAVSDYLQE